MRSPTVSCNRDPLRRHWIPTDPPNASNKRGRPRFRSSIRTTESSRVSACQLSEVSSMDSRITDENMHEGYHRLRGGKYRLPNGVVGTFAYAIPRNCAIFRDSRRLVSTFGNIQRGKRGIPQNPIFNMGYIFADSANPLSIPCTWWGSGGQFTKLQISFEIYRTTFRCFEFRTVIPG